jgi:hypothetical protein
LPESLTKQYRFVFINEPVHRILSSYYNYTNNNTLIISNEEHNSFNIDEIQQEYKLFCNFNKINTYLSKFLILDPEFQFSSIYKTFISLFK